MISIIIPLYNKSHCINRTIDSVLSQSFRDFELVIIDDGSTDGSSEKIKTYLWDGRIKYYYKKNGGVSSARNYGVYLSSGEWIVFLDADDIMLENCLLELLNLVKTYNVMVGTANLYREENKNKYLYSVSGNKHIVTDAFKECVLRRIILRTGNTIMHRDVVEAHPYRTDLSRYEDLESMINVMKEYEIAYTPVPVMIYTSDNAGLSINESNFSRDFISCLPENYDSYWEGVLYAQLYDQGLKFYSNRKVQLRVKYPQYDKLLKENKIRLLFIKNYTKIWRLIQFYTTKFKN